MIISKTCIERPVFATVLSLMLVLIGFITFFKLTVREYPKIDEPVVTVETSYLGASSEIIESQITKPLEDSLAGIEGIEVMTSISRDETSQISLRFKITRDPDQAANDVRDRVGRALKLLPDDIDAPTIEKVEADAQPIIYLAFYSDKHSAMEISDYADRYVKNRLQNLDGVSNVMIFGERKISMRLWIDPAKLASYSLTPADIEDALRQQNVEIPAGRIESKNREFTVIAKTSLYTPEQFNNLILKQKNNNLVKLKDVGYAIIAPQDERVISRFNSKSAVALGVVKQATANPLSVSSQITDVLPKISESLPKGMKINIAYDSSIFIEESIKEVVMTILEALILVIIVIFFFLRNIRSTLIPIITIPISLIGTFMMMYIFDFSINTLTLLALVLSIGLVVDDAIIMLENVYRHIEMKKTPKDAALKGSGEIAFAIIAMTITLIAVFVPVVFMEGRTGKLFVEFALTLASAVLISGFVALTLSPMMCSVLLKHEEKHGKIYKFIEKILNGLNKTYERALNWSIHHNKKIIIMGLIVALSSAFFSQILKSELAPTEDRGTILGIGIAPEGSTIDYTADWMKQLEPIYSAIPEADKYFVIAGFPVVSQGISFIGLKNWNQRQRKQQDIVAELQPKMFAGIPGIMSFPINPPSLGRSAISKPIEIVIKTTGSYEELAKITGEIMEKAKNIPGLINIDSDLKLSKPQITVDLNRDRTAIMGVKIEDVGRTLETMLGGRQVTRFERDGEQYDVIVQLNRKDRSNPQDINDIYVRNNLGQMIKLDNLIHIKEKVAPRELNHFDQLRSAKITASLAPNAALGDILQLITDNAQKTLPDNMMIDYDGESREFLESSSSLISVFILALLFIYLVLSAQFESFKDPLIIIITVPLSVAGALLMLYYFGGTLNIYSKIGLITLIGLITKHGILIVEFAHQLQQEGKNASDAVKEAALLRLRPILMTTAATIISAVPLVAFGGAGAESRRQIGLVIIGGMSIGTFFTLFVIPVIFSLVYKNKVAKPA